jgi:hypothetical protein
MNNDRYEAEKLRHSQELGGGGGIPYLRAKLEEKIFKYYEKRKYLLLAACILLRHSVCNGSRVKFISFSKTEHKLVFSPT